MCYIRELTSLNESAGAQYEIELIWMRCCSVHVGVELVEVGLGQHEEFCLRNDLLGGNEERLCRR
jgi:hypothetical protein